MRVKLWSGKAFSIFAAVGILYVLDECAGNHTLDDSGKIGERVVETIVADIEDLPAHGFQRSVQEQEHSSREIFHVHKRPPLLAVIDCDPEMARVVAAPAMDAVQVSSEHRERRRARRPKGAGGVGERRVRRPIGWIVRIGAAGGQPARLHAATEGGYRERGTRGRITRRLVERHHDARRGVPDLV